jgi:hypothetical protein
MLKAATPMGVAAGDVSAGVGIDVLVAQAVVKQAVTTRLKQVKILVMMSRYIEKKDMPLSLHYVFS